MFNKKLKFFKKIKYQLLDLIISGITVIQKLNGYSFIMPFWGIYIVITLRCNLRCPDCFVLNQATTSLNSDIPADYFKLILSKIKFFKFIKPRIHLFGGEPTVHKELPKILQYLSDEKFKVTLRTNGVINQEYFEKIIKYPCLDKVIFSIHLENFHQHIKELCTLIDESNNLNKKRKKIKTYICGTIEDIQRNNTSINEFIEQYENIGCQHIKIQHMKNIDTTNQNHNTSDNKKIIEEITLAKKTKYQIPILFSPNIKTKDLNNFYQNIFAPQKNNCLFPWFSTIITPLGNVFVCEGFQKTGENIREKSLQQIWNGKKYRQIRKGIARNGCQLSSSSLCAHRRYYGLTSKYFEF